MDINLNINLSMNLSITKQSNKGKVITFKKTITTLDSLKDIITNQAGILVVYDDDNKSVLFSRLHKDKLLSNAGSWQHIEKYTNIGK